MVKPREYTRRSWRRPSRLGRVGTLSRSLLWEYVDSPSAGAECVLRAASNPLQVEVLDFLLDDDEPVPYWGLTRLPYRLEPLLLLRDGD